MMLIPPSCTAQGTHGISRRSPHLVNAGERTHGIDYAHGIVYTHGHAHARHRQQIDHITA